MWKPRTVDAVSARHAVVDRTFLVDALRSIPDDVEPAMLGAWLGGLARRAQKRVIYTPYLEARVPDGFGRTLARKQMELFGAFFGDLATQSAWYPAGLDRSGYSPYGLGTGSLNLSRMPYCKYRALVSARSLAQSPGLSSVSAPAISILTTVYARTDASLFRDAAESVREQSTRPFEWIVLAHGPISDDLQQVLDEFEKTGLLRLLKLDHNLGISGGLRYCLERAQGDFVCWLDADDLLAPEAIETLAQAITRNPGRVIFYTDEDQLIDGQLRHPYYRPDWDPVFAFAHSFVWHLIAFSRELGLHLQAFTSADTDYAQDWDVLLRFVLSGHRPVHIRAVLYHWRQHSLSLSNSGTTFEGSLASVRAALDLIRLSQKDPDLYEVAPYPLRLGAPDYHLRRLPRKPPAMGFIRCGNPRPLLPTASPRFPFTYETTIPAEPRESPLAALLECAEAGDAELVMILGAAVLSVEDAGIWQAIRHFEFVPDVVSVGGPLLSLGGKVYFGTPVHVVGRRIVDPLAGRPFAEPAEFSINLKPHCVLASSSDLMIVRRSFLVEALRACPSLVGMIGFGAQLGSFAALKGGLIVYEPLMRGFVRRKGDLTDDGESLLPTDPGKSCLAAGDRVPRRGLAGFVRHAQLHS
jgi:hypothetical protein